MTSDKIQRVGVIGAGQMGAGVAEVCARAHVDVLVYEPTRELAAAGRSRILRSLDRGVSSGKITEREREQAAWRLRFTSDMGDFADRQLVVEAVVEDEKVKAEMFAELDEVVTDENAVLASNTSSIPIMKLGIATTAPERVIGMHFFNPVPVLPLVELVTTLKTSGDASKRAEQFASEVLGKQVVRSQDRAGLRRQRPAGAVPAVGDPDGRVGLRHRGRHRHRHGARAARTRWARCALADLIGLDTVSPSPIRCTPSSRNRCTRRRRCSCAWSRRACSAGRPAPASTSTRRRTVGSHGRARPHP